MGGITGGSGLPQATTATGIRISTATLRRRKRERQDRAIGSGPGLCRMTGGPGAPRAIPGGTYAPAPTNFLTLFRRRRWSGGPEHEIMHFRSSCCNCMPGPYLYDRQFCYNVDRP